MGAGEALDRLPILKKRMWEDRFYSRTVISKYRNGFDDIRILNPKYMGTDYQLDYFRFRTFELVANQLIVENVPGECAEVGVFRGYFSRLINEKFPKKKMYLFDTFEGFLNEEIEKEIRDGLAPECARDDFLS